jgi:hypothetical protein
MAVPVHADNLAARAWRRQTHEEVRVPLVEVFGELEQWRQKDL